MRAITFEEFGPPEVLHLAERPEPLAGPGEVVVRVAASTVNPTDLMMRAGVQVAMMAGLSPPYIAGNEFAGHVHAVGAGVQGFAPGLAVMGAVNPRRPQGGSHAEYICVPAASLVAIDPAADLAEAATIPMNGLTARRAIELLELTRGATLLVTGGAGAVGGYVIQLAKSQGVRVVADAKDSDVESLRRLGAGQIVPRGEGMAAAVRSLYPDGVDGLIDCALLGPAAAELVRDGGATVSVRRANPITDPRLRNLLVMVGEELENRTALRALETVWRCGGLTPRVAVRLPMEQAAQAHRLVEAGGQRGRVVLMFGS